jgi:hypothetical protein
MGLDGDLVVPALDQLLKQRWRWVVDAEPLQHDAVEAGEPFPLFSHGT